MGVDLHGEAAGSKFEEINLSRLHSTWLNVPCLSGWGMS